MKRTRHLYLAKSQLHKWLPCIATQLRVVVYFLVTVRSKSRNIIRRGVGRKEREGRRGEGRKGQFSVPPNLAEPVFGSTNL